MYLLRQTTVAIALLLVPLEFQPQEAKQKPAEKSAPEAQSPYFIEQYDLRVRFENDGTGWQELHVRSHVRTQRGAEQLSWIAFGYDRSSEQIEINSIVVHKPSGGAIEVLPGAVVDRPVIAVKDAPAYEDAREKTVHVPALNPGDTLEYRATKTVTKSLAPGQFWFEHSFLRDAPVGEESFEMDVPGDREIHLKIRHDGVPPAIVMESQAGNGIARRVHKWKISNENAGSTKQTASKDAAMPAANPQAPDIQLTTFQNWGEVARWYSAKESQTTAADEAISAKTAELTRDSKDDLQKLEALYSFVSQKIRTVSLPLGASGFRSQAPGQVLTQGYGTAQDKHELLAALANRIGLSAVPVLVSATRKLEEDLPSPAQFDNVITAVQLGNDFIWLDTSQEVAPFRMLASNLRNIRGLAVSRVSPGTLGALAESFHWVTTPADPPFPATQNVTVTGELNGAGKLTLRVTYALRGDAELLLRVAFYRTPREQWKTIGVLLAFSDGFRGQISEVTPSDPKATAEPFHVEFQIVQDRAVKWTEQKARLDLPLPGIGLPDLPEHLPAGRGEAPPLQLGTPLDITTRATIALPPGVTGRVPFSVSVKRDYAEYRSTYRLEGNRIVATRDLRFLMRELPSTRLGDYSAFVHAVHNDEAQEAALERLAPPSTRKHSSALAR